jgi:exopolysaccharide biosynthesis protein
MTTATLRSLTVLLLLGLADTGPRAQSMATLNWREVVPGVEHATMQRTTDAKGQPVGPFAINVLRLDLSKVRLDVVHALDEAVGLETTSSIADRLGAVAAVNGGYFAMTGTYRGDSTGTLQIDGTILSEPDRSRSAVGFVSTPAATQLLFGPIDWKAQIAVDGQPRPIDGVNRARGEHDVVIFTPGFHRTTLTDDRGVEAVVRAGKVISVHDHTGSSSIPADGMVVSARGTGRDWVLATLRPDVPVDVTMQLHSVEGTPPNPWSAAEDVLGAGPRLVAGGRVEITTARERMLPTFATDRHPRTAIGRLRDGRALLLVVDGRQPAWSVGMSLEELARLFLDFGAVDAINLDGGGSTTMTVERKIVNKPSDPAGERPVSDAIVVRPRSR